MRVISFLRSLLFAMALIVVSTASFGQIGVSIEFGPPALPVYEQPLCPGDGYLWTPGYWAYGERLLLGAGNVGRGAGSRLPLDSAVLGLGRQRISLS